MIYILGFDTGIQKTSIIVRGACLAETGYNRLHNSGTAVRFLLDGNPFRLFNGLTP
jgi:hypothetical protein